MRLLIVEFIKREIIVETLPRYKSEPNSAITQFTVEKKIIQISVFQHTYQN